MAMTVPKLQTLPAIAKYLQIPEERVRDVLEFLVTHGLAQKEADRYLSTERATHVSKDSPLALQNHFNWRMKMTDMMPYRKEKDVHFSGVVSISRKDKEKIQQLFRRMLAEFSDVVGPSKEEELCVVCLDFQSM